MKSRILPVLLGLCCLGSLASASEYFRPPNLEKKLFETDKITIDERGFDKWALKGVVADLVSVARDFDEEDGVDFDLRSNALAIASRLDPANAKIKSTLDQLKERGKTVSERAKKESVGRRLNDCVGRMRGMRRGVLMKKSDGKLIEPGPDRLTCAAYIANIAERLDPGADLALELKGHIAELAGAGYKPDWSGMLLDPERPPGERGPKPRDWEIAMPGGTAEKFARNSSTVTGLMVRQLGRGKLAGQASEVNATALPKEGLDGLAFTFNQPVGTQMGGCLEEVIKFLRVRYEVGQPELVPDGYEVELGFGNKFQPKDGPSGAVAFALLIDSLFSGEEVDPNFACTGDMTADGRVQKIGGAAAKIRGAAVKIRGAADKGLPIVGIPIGNRDEMRDVLLLDGIDPLVGIQIFTLEDFEEARDISRMEKKGEVTRALAAFEEVAKDLKPGDRKANATLLADAGIRKRLERVVELMPNHLSARLLLESGRGTLPKTLTVRGTLQQIEIVTAGTFENAGRQVFRAKFGGDPSEFGFDSGSASDAKDAMAELETLEKFVDPAVKDYLAAAKLLCQAVADGPGEDEKPAAYGKRVERLMARVAETLSGVAS
ncbi:ATP-dependent Lon protease [Haloferula helveola]|uniref:ATP-dependent Lon protease n=1 Tax=Haloferula helveola TaxID=490095 RepID=A0ABN6H1J6_9BACT|nr:ATP-dependent Lon protease [Haloferula helveola]